MKIVKEIKNIFTKIIGNKTKTVSTQSFRPKFLKTTQ